MQDVHTDIMCAAVEAEPVAATIVSSVPVVRSKWELVDYDSDDRFDFDTVYTVC